ncbi:hypothetical protein BDY19DRAFT_977301 [Irpex rosettiformis]|uniref:Uncharacterized protein n=1 Tax=Irpex rosettiformis TaxID=378272 RepID=A0ACB8TNI8_9APHY|nr:hypothetical protein BDY19DRAFT_977301 [Irpex rosettiformis]
MLLVLRSLMGWALGRVYVGCLLGISDVVCCSWDSRHYGRCARGRGGSVLEISWLCTRTISFATNSYPIMIFVLDGHILSVSNGTAMSTLSRCIIVASYYIYV